MRRRGGGGKPEQRHRSQGYEASSENLLQQKWQGNKVAPRRGKNKEEMDEESMPMEEPSFDADGNRDDGEATHDCTSGRISSRLRPKAS